MYAREGGPAGRKWVAAALYKRRALYAGRAIGAPNCAQVPRRDRAAVRGRAIAPQWALKFNLSRIRPLGCVRAPRQRAAINSLLQSSLAASSSWCPSFQRLPRLVRLVQLLRRRLASLIKRGCCRRERSLAAAACSCCRFRRHSTRVVIVVVIGNLSAAISERIGSEQIEVRARRSNRASNQAAESIAPIGSDHTG